MKACVLHKPGDIRVEDVDIPKIGGNEVLVKPITVGHCGSDLSRINKTGYYHYPHIPGHEFAGEIAEVSDGIDDFKAGDRVAVIPLIPCLKCVSCEQGLYSLCVDYGYIGSRSDGALAEYVKAPVSNLVKLPDSVSWDNAAVIDPAAVALHGFNRVNANENEKMVIFGMGPIGLLTLQHAVARGYEYIATVDVDESKLKLAQEYGATLCIDNNKVDAVKEIMKTTDNLGATLIFDTSSVPETKVQCLQVSSRRGKVVYIGRPYGSFTFTVDDFEHMLRTETLMCTSINYSFTKSEHDWKTVVDLMSKGFLNADKMITHRFSLEETPQAYYDMWAKKYEYNKVIFYPQE